MESVFQLLAALAVVVGTTFSVLGILGVLRMPDVYTRLHATGKIGVFGAVLLLVAAILVLPKGAGKGIVLIFFLLLAGPVTAHSLSSAAYRIGIPFAKPMRNDLAAVTETFDADEQAEPQRKA
ncbi:MAG: monovalent cation/H(+) antiporter subunit G [Anaerolineae bacterium]|nr:monovalent cation/H(+) antiporter subunit G [Anaerolineae bacterium]